MKVHSLVKKAIEFADLRHKNQKYDIHDYMFHLNHVYIIISDYSDDGNILAASYLHDIMEDTKTSYEEIYSGFNEYVADLVFQLTDPKGKNRKERKLELYKRFNLLEMSKFKSEIALIKCADRFANMSYSFMNNDLDKMKMYCSEWVDFKYFFVNNLPSYGYNLANSLEFIINESFQMLKD